MTTTNIVFISRLGASALTVVLQVSMLCGVLFCPSVLAVFKSVTDRMRWTNTVPL